MAIDAYLQIDGIKSESQGSAHQGWIELTSVMTASMEQMISQGSILHDNFGLRFSRVKWKYTQQKIGGGAGGNTSGGWDLAANKAA
jgi:type VI secretion system secreted protein Hcp